eukprot:6138754-Prymnesium_polylepis.1
MIFPPGLADDVCTHPLVLYIPLTARSIRASDTHARSRLQSRPHRTGSTHTGAARTLPERPLSPFPSCSLTDTQRRTRQTPDRRMTTTQS